MLFEDRQKNRKTGPTLVGFNASQYEHQNTVCPTHPESSDRILKIKEALTKTKVLEKCQVLDSFLEIDDADLEVTHEKTMVKELAESEKKTQEEINSQCEKYDSVFMTQNSIKVAKDGVACVRELANRIMMNEASNGFAIIRPPGHHADAKSPCGFCIFNNVAQAAEEAFFNGAERILIIDLDAHHGHGTQRIFYEDKRVMYFSIHRYEYGLYWPHLPESNFDYIGAGAGVGFNANLPLNETGCTDSDYLSILFHVLLPLATQFDPHFVIVSAGFDSLLGDPLGGMCLTPDGYSHFIYHLKALAQGRMLVVLEGGYNHQVSAVAVTKCVKVLLGHSPYPVNLDAPPKESTVTSCINLVTVLRHHWNCFDYFPSRTSLRLAQWPIVNSKVEFKYDPSSRPADTGEIHQDKLDSVELLKSDILPSEEMETIIYFNEGDDAHHDLEEEDRHPEKPARTRRILKTLRESGVLVKCIEKNSERSATDEEIRMVHTKKMLEHLKETESMKDEELMEEAENEFNSIYLTRDTLKVARKAAGTVLQSVDDIFKKGAGQRNALVIVRPPGHHASASKSSGFCIFNNVAVAAKYAQRRHRVKRVLILDWDVHHGNGTQEIFYEDSNVMYMSIHRHEKGNFYPVGEPKDYFDVGEGDGEGMSVNIPFSGASMGDSEYQMAFQRVILPIAYQFNPELVLISAGFDAAVDDPLGDYRVTPETFALITYQLSSLAAGRVITVLEGGYNLTSISNSALAVCEVLQNRSMLRRLQEEKEHFGTIKSKLESSSIKTIREVCAVQQKYWNILQGFQIIIGSVTDSKFINKNGKPNASKSKSKGKAATDPIPSSNDGKRTYRTRQQRRSERASTVDDVMAKIENLKL
uniref:histone deacetylase n=1 Tax=Caenorhabditis tropicalis TaxID=1561998 RepID=A0A1I7T3W5_9PELO